MVHSHQEKSGICKDRFKGRALSGKHWRIQKGYFLAVQLLGRAHTEATLAKSFELH